MTTRDRLALARLYAITADDEPAEVERQVAHYLGGGADVVQLRQKTMPRGRLLELAERLCPRVQAAGALFIVDDHLDIALLSAADGVHLGPDDLSVAGARRVAGPGLIIGASASTTQAAHAAVRAGADYLGSGPAFATPLKPEKDVIGPLGVAGIAGAVQVPVFAIGGIDATNLDELLAAGVRRVCVIRALAEAPDPEAMTRQLARALAS